MASSARTYTLKEAEKSILYKWDWENPLNNITTFLWGPIGIGKTWLINQLVAKRMVYENNKIINKIKEAHCHDDVEIDQLVKLKKENKRLTSFVNPKEVQDLLDKHLLVFRLAERPLEQIQGIPAPNFESSSCVFLMPHNIVTIAKNASWLVLFVDEVDKADEVKMAAATHLLESGQMGDFSFPKDSFIVAASNRMTDSWLSKPVPPELRNRAAHIELRADLASFTEFGDKVGIRKDIISFLHFREKSKQGSRLIYVDSTSGSDTPNAFYTPRTWHKASDQATKLDGKESIEYIADEIKQLVGEQVGNEFLVYIKLYRSVDINKIYNGEILVKKALASNFEELSRQFAITYAIVDQVTEEALEDETNMQNFVKNLLNMHNDLAVVLVQSLWTRRKGIITILMQNESGKQFIEKFYNAIS